MLTDEQMAWLAEDRLHDSTVDDLIETGRRGGFTEIPQANALRALLELKALRKENQRLRTAENPAESGQSGDKSHINRA